MKIFQILLEIWSRNEIAVKAQTADNSKQIIIHVPSTSSGPGLQNSEITQIFGKPQIKSLGK